MLKLYQKNPIQRVPIVKSPQTTKRRAGCLSRPSSVEFRSKLNFAHQTTSCTCSQGALFIGLQLTTPLHRQTFFLSDGCMAQRGRCPGGRPSVSANKRIRCRLFCRKVATVQASYEHRIRSAVSQRVPLSVLASPMASSN